MTDGILLAETQGDRFLDAYDTIIIDEAHERSLNIDFLLGYLKQLLPRRPDLKLIITSATIDPQRFSQALRGTGRRAGDRSLGPDLPGRGALPAAARARTRTRKTSRCSRASSTPSTSCRAQGPGDILVFLSGEREIRETAEALRKHHPPGTEILPLYARLSAAEQMRVFQPHGKPRIVLATNVAETSLTVPGIRYVIDPGYARLSRYSPRTKVQRLPIERISQASADQRKGRCGRVGPGVCVRLYSEEDFEARPQFTDPEILRTNLASVILQMKAFRLGAVQDFPFVEPPDYRAVRDGYATLHELGAIDERNELTDLGHALARLPVDPRIGRMVLAARDENCMEEVLVIAAALSVQDPRERPMDKQEAADEAHKQFRDENSDFLSYPEAVGLLPRPGRAPVHQQDAASCARRTSCRSCACASGTTSTASSRRSWARWACSAPAPPRGSTRRRSSSAGSVRRGPGCRRRAAQEREAQRTASASPKRCAPERARRPGGRPVVALPEAAGPGEGQGGGQAGVSPGGGAGH